MLRLLLTFHLKNSNPKTHPITNNKNLFLLKHNEIKMKFSIHETFPLNYEETDETRNKNV